MWIKTPSLTVLCEFGGAEQGVDPDTLAAGAAEVVVAASRGVSLTGVPRQTQVRGRILPQQHRQMISGYCPLQQTGNMD